MNPIEQTSSAHRDEEISALVEVLFKTGQRIEELTVGEVDAVVDHDGRTFLFRGSHDQLRHGEALKQASILNALPANIALLDNKGAILSVNDSWQRFATANLSQCGPRHGIGFNYLEACDGAQGDGSPEWHLVGEGIRSVLRGAQERFSIEYASDSAAERQWFNLTVTPLVEDRPKGVILMHLDVTDRKRAGEVLRQSDEKLRMLVSGVKDYALLMLDPEGRVTTWNEGAARIQGYHAEEIIGEHFSRFYTPEAIARGIPAQALELAAEQGRSEQEGMRVRKDGSEFWANVVITALRDEKGRLKGFAKVTRDNTDRKQADSKLQLLTERLSLATTVAKVGVWEWDLASDILTWDATMFAIYDFPPMASMLYHQWSAAVHPDDLPAVEAALRRAVDEKGDGSADFRIILADGTVRHISAVERAVVDQSANVIRVIGVNVDVTKRKEAEEAHRNSEARMTQLAERDFLTGLPNRMVMNDRINQAIERARRYNKKAALLYLDMDGFKHINDSLGHPIGDKLIQSIAKRLANCVRASDTVSRQGGDEFLVLLPEVEHPEDTTVAVKRILEAVAKIHSIDQHDLHVTTSIGVSIYPDDGSDAETLIKNADTAMYQAKENQRRNYEFFDPAMNLLAVERHFIEESLRRALERQEFALHYQPKIDFKSGAITGAEALIRWTHPTRGPISPAQFIPIAEDSGLIVPIGSWVLREACTQAQSWLEAGLPAMTMAVNVSGRQFQSDNFVEGLFAVLNETGLEPKSLEIEVTESLLMKRPDFTASILRVLRDRGVQVAIDDFGTGYSSLSYLHQLPIDALKIDQSFVRRISTTPNQTSIVTAIISMGKSLKLRVIAEGVETAEEHQFLQAQDCDEAQGYYFSVPVPPHQFAALLKTPAWIGTAAAARGSCLVSPEFGALQEPKRRSPSDFA